MLLAIGDLLEEILMRLRDAPVRGIDNTVRSARVRGGSAANVAAIDAERWLEAGTAGATDHAGASASAD